MTRVRQRTVLWENYQNPSKERSALQPRPEKGALGEVCSLRPLVGVPRRPGFNAPVFGADFDHVIQSKECR